MRTSRILSSAVIIAAASLAGTAWAMAADPRTPGKDAAKERLETFQWFSTLGFQDVKGLKCVRVQHGSEKLFGQEDKPPIDRFCLGFLLDEKGDTFRVYTFSRQTLTFTKTPPETPPHERVAYEIKTLDEVAKRVQNRGGTNPTETWLEGYPDKPADMFTLAWACWREGQEENAAWFYDRAMWMTAWHEREDKALNFPQKVAEELADEDITGATLDLHNRDLSREQLLARFEKFLKLYPDTQYAPRVKEIATALARMVEEDKQHAKERSQGKPWDQLNRPEQIAELIFQIRDQNGGDSGFGCYIFGGVFADNKVTHDTPADRLVAIGADAAPQLIEALDDKRLSRAVGLGRYGMSYDEVYILTVGDCAEQILEKIAGRPFPRGGNYLHKGGDVAAVKKSAAAWFADLQQKGEKQLLIETIEKADPISSYLVDRLVEKYPDAAIAAIVGGVGHISQSKDPWNQASTREALVTASGKLADDAPIPFLLQELKTGPLMEDRLRAAEILHRRKQPEAVAAMIREWLAQKQDYDEHDRFAQVGRFLADCDSLEAIQTLGKTLNKRNCYVRKQVMDTLVWRCQRKYFTDNGQDGEVAKVATLSPDQKARWNATIEFLLQFLEDNEQRTGDSNSRNNRLFFDPRICDVACEALHQLDPQKYPFDCDAPIDERDRCVALIKNIARTDRGQPILPLPELRQIANVPDAKLLPLLDRLQASPDKNSAAISAEIEKLGIGALAGCRKRLESLPAEDAHRAAIARLIERLASTVVDIQISAKSVTPEPALVAKPNQFRGKPFAPKQLADLTTALIKNPPQPVYGFRFTVGRTCYGAGVVLRVDLYNRARAEMLYYDIPRQEAAPKDPPRGWRSLCNAQAGNKELDWFNEDSRLPQENDLLKILQHVVSTPADTPVEVRIQCTGDW